MFTVGGTFAFTLQPSGRVDVDIPDAHVDINVPINGSHDEVFGLDGDAKFSFGGGLGFQLQQLTLNGVTILGHDARPRPLDRAGARRRRPSSCCRTPARTSTSRRSTTNGYIEVQYTDNSGAGLNVASITDSDNEIALTGAAAAGVTLHGAGVQVDPVNNPGLFKYTFDGSLRHDRRATRTTRSASSSSPAASPTRTARRTRRRTSSSSSSATATRSVPTAQLASPLNGASIAPRRLPGAAVHRRHVHRRRDDHRRLEQHDHRHRQRDGAHGRGVRPS